MRYLFRFSLGLIGYLAVSLHLFAQPAYTAEDLAPCGYSGKSAWLTAYQNGEIAIPRSSCDSLVIGIKLHIVGNSEGGGYISMERMVNAFQTLQNDYAPFGIYFYIQGGINFIDNSSYYDHTIAVGRNMMMENNAPGLINTYIVGSPNGNCGYYTGSQDAIALAISCTNVASRTWSHEIGHYLSLPHTFVGWNSEEPLPLETPAPSIIGTRTVEKANQVNCSSAGDGFCDTPPDYLAFRWTCNSAGVYADSLLDPDSVRFAVPGWPIMGYSSNTCRSGFSEQQAEAMRAYLQFRGDHIQCIPFGEQAAVGEDIDLLFPENGADLSTTDTLQTTLRWTSIPGADFYVVQLNRTQFFGTSLLREITVTDTSLVVTEEEGLQFNRRLFWRVLPINRFQPVSNPTPIYSFRITELLSATKDPLLEAAISLYPNPLPAARQSLFIQARQLPSAAPLSIQVFNTQGQCVATKWVEVLADRELAQALPLSHLSNGVYFIRLQQEDRIVTKRFLVGGH